MVINKCAKCGGEAEHIKLFDSKRYDCFFRCKSCGRETAVYTSKQNAVEAWNSGKLNLTNADMIELLRKRALAGRMSVQDKQVMLEAADKIESLVDDVAELEAIVDLRSKREWYSKFVKEVFQKIPGKELSHPDFDYIYEQYFGLKNRLEVEQIMKKKLQEKLTKAEHDRDRYARKIEELTTENEQWRSDWSENQAQWDEAYEKLEVENEKLSAQTLQKVQERFALHFGTYTDKDTVRVLDVIKLLSEIE